MGGEIKRASEEEESKMNVFCTCSHFFSLLFKSLFVNWVQWAQVSEIRVVISLYSSFLISGFLLLSSFAGVCHTDRTTLNIDVLSSLSILAYTCSLFLSLLTLVISSIRSPMLQQLGFQSKDLRFNQEVEGNMFLSTIAKETVEKMCMLIVAANKNSLMILFEISPQYLP